MGSSDSKSRAVSAAFREQFLSAAGAYERLRFDQFMALALYAPGVGYYRRERSRVGYDPGTDFFTASTSGPVFGELVAAAAEKLLAGRDRGAHTFVEIGAEPGGGILDGVSHPFAAVRTVRVSEALALSGDCIVFSNELFDAQPFRRFRAREGRWHELGVALAGDILTEVLLPIAPETLPPWFALPAPEEGYVIDAPLGAATLLREIARHRWRGAFIAFDYGKSWRELAAMTPQGTARAYHRHTQSNDLLAQPGEQDITCHVCWDWLEAALGEHGFASPVIDAQESFLVRHAGDYIARVVETEAAHFSRKKLSLMQLLHPSHLGRKFQVLHAVR